MTLGETTDTDKVINAQNFGSDPTDIPDHFWLRLDAGGGLCSLSTVSFKTQFWGVNSFHRRHLLSAFTSKELVKERMYCASEYVTENILSCMFAVLNAAAETYEKARGCWFRCWWKFTTARLRFVVDWCYFIVLFAAWILVLRHYITVIWQSETCRYLIIICFDPR